VPLGHRRSGQAEHREQTVALILGVFDLLAYAIPGSLYLAAFAYISHRAGWIEASDVLALPSVVLLIGAAIATFLMGQAAHPLGSLIDRINPFGATDLSDEARESFLRRNPKARSRRFLQVDPFTLLAALEVGAGEAAADVARLRSVGQMLSRAVPALALGVLIAVVEIFTGRFALFAALTGVVLALVGAGCLRQSATFRRWAIVRTYELSYWDNGMYARLADGD
jgi:hypothetical protein